ncbi:SDR family NAD(P)-dependent oxidoreductase [Brucella sp. IR073]|uniref:SDR family NAD(P)-dependent oxidoreductase n=1 Tax=unclassified Brucella TaxID=2632610 RepID=UPI003B9854F1
MSEGKTTQGLKRRSVLAGMAATMAAVPVSASAKPGEADARRFENKVVVVTGGTSGIGRATVLAFAREGAKVGFCGRRTALGRQVEAEVRARGGEATYIKADVQIAAEVKQFVDRVADAYGGLDVAFNNAGINFSRPLHEIDEEDWNRLNDTNVRGVFLAMKYQIPHLLKRGGGTIVVTSSAQAVATRAGGSAYTASKRALVGLVQAAALDYGPRGIRVNAIAPGTVDTPMVREMAGSGLDDAAWAALARKWAEANIPTLKRMATPEEIATAVLSLASDEFPFLTGSTLSIDGGMTAQL